MARVKGTVQSVFEDARDEIESLKDEMESWKDGMESSEALTATEKYPRIEESCNMLEEALEHLHEIDGLPERVRHKEASVEQKQRKPAPGWLRLENAVKRLGEVIAAVEALCCESTVEEDGMTLVDAGLDDMVDSLRCAEDVLASVEFPGMFG